MKRFFSLLLLVCSALNTLTAMDVKTMSLDSDVVMTDLDKTKDKQVDSEGDTQMAAPVVETISCFQATVIRQSGPSCGYHALKNGILIARAILNNANPEQELLSDTFVTNLFDTSNTRWRAFVLDKRARTLASKHILKALRTLLENNTTAGLDMNERQAFNQALNAAASLLSRTGTKTEVDKTCVYTFSITPETIANAIIAAAQQAHTTGTSLKQEGVAIYETIATKEKVAQYLPELSSIEFTVKNDSTVTSKDGMYSYCWLTKSEKKDTEAVGKPGEWLAAEEIDLLARFELSQAENSLFAGQNIPVIAIEPSNMGFIFNNQDNLQSLVQSIRNVQARALAVFVLHLPGHWVTCVVNKQPNQQPCYIIADSLCSDISNNLAVRELIKCLEGKEVVLKELAQLDTRLEKLKAEINALVAKINQLKPQQLDRINPSDRTTVTSNLEIVKMLVAAGGDKNKAKNYALENFRSQAQKLNETIEKLEGLKVSFNKALSQAQQDPEANKRKKDLDDIGSSIARKAIAIHDLAEEIDAIIRSVTEGKEVLDLTVASLVGATSFLLEFDVDTFTLQEVLNVFESLSLDVCLANQFMTEHKNRPIKTFLKVELIHWLEKIQNQMKAGLEQVQQQGFAPVEPKRKELAKLKQELEELKNKKTNLEKAIELAKTLD